MRAYWRNAQHTDVVIHWDDGVNEATKPDDPRLVGVTIEDFDMIHPAPITAWRKVMLLGAGVLTAAEAEAWASRNAVPAFLQDLIDGMPESDRPAATITMLTMALVEREHPWVRPAADAAGAMLGRTITDEEIDGFWRSCALL